MSGLRFRVVVTFALLAALVTIGAGLGSWLLVREDRIDRAEVEASELTASNLALAAELLAPPIDLPELEAVDRALEARGGFVHMTVIGTEVRFQTSVSLGLDAVPAGIVSGTADGQVLRARTVVDGRLYVVTGGRFGADGPAYYFFYDNESIREDLERLRLVLLLVGLVAVVLAGGAGFLSAGRVLGPVRQARDGARRLREGDLGVRIAVRGSDDLAELSEAFNEMATTLEATVGDLTEMEATQRRFVADVSHELRTPLTALMATAEILESRIEEEDHPDARVIRLLVGEVRRLRMLVEDLMEISRLDAGAADVRPETVELARFVQTCLQRRSWIGLVETDVAEVTLTTDPRRLETVLANLVGNALDHGEPPVTIQASASGSDLRVEVVDHGSGVPIEDRERIFERFYKADPARPRSGSSGLGLAISRDNARLLGGELMVVDAPEGPMCIRLELPGIVAES